MCKYTVLCLSCIPSHHPICPSLYLFIFYPSLLVPILYELHFLFPQGDIKRTAEERTKLLVLLSKDALDVILQASMCVLHVCGVHHTRVLSTTHTAVTSAMMFRVSCRGRHAPGSPNPPPPPPTIKKLLMLLMNSSNW